MGCALSLTTVAEIEEVINYDVRQNCALMILCSADSVGVPISLPFIIQLFSVSCFTALFTLILCCIPSASLVPGT